MRQRIVSIILAIGILLCLCGCTNTSGNSTFSIHFIDVGQGDAALVECDGYYMLIDGGSKSSGDKVYEVLEEQSVRKLHMLVLSHLHEDHVGGLTKALRNISKINYTLSNQKYSDKDFFVPLEKQLRSIGSKIVVPNIDSTYKLGSATIKVVDVSSAESNDSLVLLITYGDTRFLFTGDIEDKAQTRISDKFQNDMDKPFKVDVVKMPHHGSYTGTLYRFLRTFMPDTVVISVGAGNAYGHPHDKTLQELENKTWTPNLYRTDLDGDIFIKSNGVEISVDTSK